MLDELKAEPLRLSLVAIGPTMHQTDDDPPRSLASRNLLQRTVLAAAVVARARPDRAELPDLIRQAEKSLAMAMANSKKNSRQFTAMSAPILRQLAFLYDLRLHGGLAHPASPVRAADAAVKLGLPRSGWRRRDFVQFLELVTHAIDRAAIGIGAACRLL